jgi:DNA-binding MarR family transcriptional regulator
MADTALLTGQDIGEAEGAMTALLERALAPSGRSRAEYITLRLLAARAPFGSAAELSDFLAGQRQLGLNRADVVTMLDRLQAEGVMTVAPVELTADGRAVLEDLAAAVAPVTRRVFAGLDREDLTVAHRVLVELIQHARTMTNVA